MSRQHSRIIARRIFFIICPLVLLTSCSSRTFSKLLLTDSRAAYTLNKVLGDYRTDIVEQLFASTVGVIAIALTDKDGKPIDHRGARRTQSTGIVVTARYVAINKHPIEFLDAIDPDLPIGEQNDRVAIKIFTSADVGYMATLYHVNSMSDLAIVEITEKVEGVAPVIFRDSDSVKVAEEVHSMDMPLGLFGVAHRGSISTKSSSRARNKDTEPMLIVNMDINPGNSGGPLFDNHGMVIGIITRAIPGLGIAFAIPSNIITGYLLSHQLPITIA